MEYGKYLAIILATIFVIISQFTASSICLILAFSLYTVGFCFMFIGHATHAYEIYKADKLVKDESLTALTKAETEKDQLGAAESELKDKNVEVVSLKSEKAWTVIGSIFFGILTIFTFVTLVLYSVKIF